MVELVTDVPSAAEAAVLQEIRRIAAEELEWTRPVQPADDLLRDLQLDSLGLTVLAVGLENRFRVRLTEEDSAGSVGPFTGRPPARPCARPPGASGPAR